MAQLYTSGSYAPWTTQIAFSSIMDRNHNIAIVGNCTDANKQNSAFAIKYTGDVSGWQKNYPGPFDTSFRGIVELTNGTYMAVGSYFDSENVSGEKIWCVNLDTEGAIIWSEIFGEKGKQSAGMCISAAADGGFFIAGYDFSGGRVTAKVMRFSSHRSLLWERNIPDVFCYSVYETSDGGCILSGGNTLGKNMSNPLAIKLDNQGNITLNKAFTSASVYMLLQSDCVPTADGNYIMAAKNITLKFDSKGNEIWMWNIANADFGSVLQHPSGNFAFAGSINVENMSAAYCVMTDSSGNNIIWDNSEMESPSAFTSIFMDPRAGGVVFTGGYAPLNNIGSEVIFGAFNPVKKLVGG